MIDFLNRESVVKLGVNGMGNRDRQSASNIASICKYD